MTNRIYCLPIVFCVALSVSQSLASGDVIAIVNSSFEDPVLNDGVNVVGWEGWQLYSPATTRAGGTWNINGESTYWNVSAPHGNNVGYLTNGNFPEDSASGTQSLGVNLLADSNYQLSFFVGHPIGYATGTQYEAGLYAGQNILASISGTGPEGSFQQVQLDFDSTGSSFIGEELSIYFFSSRVQTAFDDIRLSVSSVPEPATIVPWCVAGLAGVGLARRQRHKTA